MTTAINVFARAVVRQRKIPFEIFDPEVDITEEGAMQAFYHYENKQKKTGFLI